MFESDDLKMEHMQVGGAQPSPAPHPQRQQSMQTERNGVIHRQSLSVPFAIWGDDGGGVAVVTHPANVVLTGQEVLLLTGKT